MSVLRLALCAVALVLAGVGYVQRPVVEARFAEPLLPDPSLPPQFETVFDYRSPEGTAHAPAILPGEGGAFGLIWFDGIRESHNDVRILGVSFPGPSGVTEVATRHSVSKDLAPRQTILTLGNTIGDGQGGLLATAVSLGGWAASSIAHLPVQDGVIGTGRRLSLSPLLGRSHLVKSPVVAMAGGGHLVPVYFEMETAYGVAAHVDAAGRVRGQYDMRGGDWRGIQPMVVPLSDMDAVALLRNFTPGGGPLLASWTKDAGQSWSAPVALDLPNPSAPVAAVRLSDGRLLMAFNDDPKRAETLTLAISADGGRVWTRGAVLAGSVPGDLRYPAMQVLGDGRIVLTYSSGSKAGIAAHVFTESWAVQP